MINLVLSILAGAVVALIVRLFTPHWVACIVPGVLVMSGAYVVLARRIATKIQQLGEQVQAQLQTPVRTEKDRDALLDRAVKLLEGGFQWARWQFFITPAIHAQIGMLLFFKKDYENARPHLEKAFSREWMAKAMLGVVHYVGKDEAKMKAAFEEAVTNGKKEALSWGVYAWCLENSKQHDAAIALAGRAVTENPSDEKLKKLQNQLQNNKRLKMNQFEPMWWQFGLEKPPMEMPRPQMRFQRGRRY
jgi:tetratricopeptide (TPR) repeat protein